MSPWNAQHYLKFGDERTRPAADLVTRIRLDAPQRIVDLGCGPGNSTQVLRARWPEAEVCGVDNSPAMIESARTKYPDQEWILADVADWTADKPLDLVFSNAAFQWLRNHQELIPRLFSQVADGGALAFQIPSRTYATVRVHILEISEDAAWHDRMTGPRTSLTMEYPPAYYDALAERAAELNIWETEYFHVMGSSDAIIDWMSSTGLRPFLAALADEREKQRFLSLLRARVADSYPPRVDGRVLFPFRRTFVIAYR
jgi:trans-aconitate 2-methyltransferase